MAILETGNFYWHILCIHSQKQKLGLNHNQSDLLEEGEVEQEVEPLTLHLLQWLSGSLYFNLISTTFTRICLNTDDGTQSQSVRSARRGKGGARGGASHTSSVAMDGIHLS